MKHIVILSILSSTSDVFSSEKLTVINSTQRTICIAYDHQAFCILPEQTRELDTEKNLKEVEVTVLNCMSTKTKMKLSHYKKIIVVEVNRNISVIENGHIIGQVSL